MRHLTVRNVPEELADALKREQGLRGGSMNQTVLDLLGQSLGVGPTRSNGLARLGGKWSAEEFREFETATAPFDQIDTDLER